MHLYEPIFPHHHFPVSTSLIWKILLLLALLFAAPFLAGCRQHASEVAAAGATISLSSAALRDGKVPRECTCDGEDRSPPLTWTAPPAGTKSIALTVTDPDAPSGTFSHWILFNLPPNATGLPEAYPKQPYASGTTQGRNDFGRVGYNGPCPPPGKPHRYIFTLYALDTELNVPAGATRAQIESAMQGHVLARGELMGLYGR